MLAWWRTALAVTCGGAALLRYATPQRPQLIGAALALTIACLAALLAATLRDRELRHTRPAAPSPHLVLGLASAVATGGITTLLLLVL